MALRKKSAASKETETTEAAEKPAAKKSAQTSDVRRQTSEKAARKPAPPAPSRDDAPVFADARATQRSTRQSPYKMRLVIDQIRGRSVNDALGILKFSKKHAAKQIEKVLNSAVANAEFAARQGNEALDVDELYVKWAVVNEGPKIKRFMPAAQGRATPIHKRTSHVEIVIGARDGK